MACNGNEMRWTIGAATDRGIHHDGIFECLARQYLLRSEIFPHHLHDAKPGFIGYLSTLTIGRWYAGTSRKAHAERFGEAVHGERGAHRIAMTRTGDACARAVHELLIINL